MGDSLAIEQFNGLLLRAFDGATFMVIYTAECVSGSLQNLLNTSIYSKSTIGLVRSKKKILC